MPTSIVKCKHDNSEIVMKNFIDSSVKDSLIHWVFEGWTETIPIYNILTIKTFSEEE